MTNLKKYKNLVWVEVAFWEEKEILYFEWTQEEFRKKLQYDFVYFQNLHRNVLRSKIKDFWPVKSEKEKTREMKLSSLTSEQKSKVKEYIKNMQKNIGREPTDIELDKMIHKAVHWFTEEEKQEKLDEKGRKKTIEFIRKMRERKEKTWKYF